MAQPEFTVLLTSNPYEEIPLDPQPTIPVAKFNLGQINWTRGARALLASWGEEPTTYLERFARGQWSDNTDHASASNNARCIRRGSGTIFDIYGDDDGGLLIRTNARQTMTTIMIPDEM